MVVHRLDLVNFQRHAKISIGFDRIVTIVGPTDAGKSAVVRALRWAAFNKPGGRAFVRHGKKGCRVVLTIDGRQITRRRGRKNTYELDGKVFAAFGAGVPAEISRLLNLDEVNFQGQHAAPYWLSDSPGEVSRQLNRIVNLGSIDNALRNVGAAYRGAAAAVTVSWGRLKAAKARRRELAWVPEYLAKLGDLEKQEAGIAAKRNRIAALRSVLADVESAERGAAGRRGAILAGTAAVAAGERAGGAELQVGALRELIHILTETEAEYRNRADGRKLVSAELAKVRVCPVCQKPMT